MDKGFSSNLFSNAQFDVAIKQTLLSLFCLFVFVVLFYFYTITVKNVAVKKHNSTGLLFLSLSFFTFFLLGITQVFFKNNWMNEVRFKDLATFYTEGVDKEMIEKFLNSQITLKDLKDDWKTELKNSNLETVIEEMIMIAEKRNESLEMLLTLASRNTRNNNARYISNIIDEEDYKLERNKISGGIIYMLESLQL